MEVNGIRYFNAPFTEVLDTGDKDLMKRFVEDSYAKRNQLCHGADSEDFIYFWTDWEIDVEAIMKNAHAGKNDLA